MGASKKQQKKAAQMRNGFAVLAVAAILMLAGGLFLIAQAQCGNVKVSGSYTTTKLVASSYSNVISCSGTISPVRTVDVYAPQNGEVDDLYVQEGDHVLPGDTLFTVESEGSDEEIEVVADAPGTVINLQIKEGSQAGEFIETPALQIADKNVLVAVIQVPEYVATLISTGQEVEVASTASGRSDLTGTIVDIASKPAVSVRDKNGEYRDVTLMFGDTHALAIGETVNANVSIKDYGEVFYVPSQAVLTLDGASYVDIIRTGGIVERHQVRLLDEADDGQKIISGDALVDGQSIRADLSE